MVCREIPVGSIEGLELMAAAPQRNNYLAIQLAEHETNMDRLTEGRVLGKIEADCGVCALKVRDRLYLGAIVVLQVNEGGALTCAWEQDV